MKKDNCMKQSLHSRRIIMKMAVAGAVTAAFPLTFSAGPAKAETPKGGSRMLTVYYSRTGNTRDMAGRIHRLAGGDIVELETVSPYPAEYRATTEQAKKELQANFYPPLKVTVEDISAYDVIFVGSPSWWGTFASPVRGFLAQHNFSGKKLAPFITHEGSGMGRSVADMQSLCPGATILEGLAVRGGSVGAAQSEIVQWLNRIGVNKQGG